MRLYSYIVVSDSGFAPNPYHGYCTLACCKPRIRKIASVDDWVIGLTPKRLGHKLIYAMKIQETLLIADYWRDTRFARKRPDFRSEYGSLGDNIYEPKEIGIFRQHRSRHSAIDPSISQNCYKRYTAQENEQTKTRDLSGNRVLVAAKPNFVYFGIGDAIELPSALRKALAVGIGHKSVFPSEIIKFWLAFIGKQPRGIHRYEPTISKTTQQCFRPPSKVVGNNEACR